MPMRLQSARATSRAVRIGLSTLTAIVVGAVATVAVPSAAHAGQIPCPPGIFGVAPAQATGGGSTDGVVGIFRYYYTTISATPTFNVSDSRVAINNLGTPISATFTSQQSRTFSITVTVGTSASLMGFLTASVSASIQQSRTTSIGVSTTAGVPAYSTVRGDYGVQAYDVHYNAQKILTIGNTKCYDYGTTAAFTNAPTNIEGWRVSLA